MMWELFKNQFIFFWHIIRTRFLFWLTFITVAIFILTIQISNNPHISIFSLFFDGISYAIVQTQHAELPILWFTYFFIPLLILLNSFQELWQKRTIHIRGLQIPPNEFVKVNLLLIAFITTNYSVITIAIMFFTSTMLKLPSHIKLNIGILFCIVTLGVSLLLLLQTIINRFSSILGLIIPGSILIITAYTSFYYNPLNSLMLTRISPINIWIPIFNLAISNIIMILGYLILEHNIKLN